MQTMNLNEDAKEFKEIPNATLEGLRRVIRNLEYFEKLDAKALQDYAFAYQSTATAALESLTPSFVFLEKQGITSDVRARVRDCQKLLNEKKDITSKVYTDAERLNILLVMKEAFNFFYNPLNDVSVKRNMELY